MEKPRKHGETVISSRLSPLLSVVGLKWDICCEAVAQSYPQNRISLLNSLTKNGPLNSPLPNYHRLNSLHCRTSNMNVLHLAPQKNPRPLPGKIHQLLASLRYLGRPSGPNSTNTPRKIWIYRSRRPRPSEPGSSRVSAEDI